MLNLLSFFNPLKNIFKEDEPPATTSVAEIVTDDLKYKYEEVKNLQKNRELREKSEKAKLNTKGIREKYK